MLVAVWKPPLQMTGPLISDLKRLFAILCGGTVGAPGSRCELTLTSVVCTYL